MPALPAARGALAGACLLAVVSGCAGPGPGLTPVGDATRRATSPVDHGLDLITWIADDPAAVSAALLTRLDDAALGDAPRAVLDRNGICLVRVPRESLSDVQAELGRTSLEVNAWHGQVTSWRELRSRRVREQGEGLVVDGRARRFAGGELELVLRSWTVTMEDGPRLYLEVEGRYAPGPNERVDPGAIEGLRRVGFAALLEPEHVYVMTGLAPSELAVDSGPGPGAGPGFGPGAAPPMTVGEYLFTEVGRHSGHGLVVFQPRLGSNSLASREALE